MVEHQNSIPEPSYWKKCVEDFQRSSFWRPLWQLANTFVPYFGLWCVMYYTCRISWWLTLPLALLAGGFLVRVFIIFHDCCHNSFFRTRRANDMVGLLASCSTMTPYYHWRWEHAIHHAHAANLDCRGKGDVWTMTVEEYLNASWWTRLCYRFSRNAVVLFFIAPLWVFLVWYRFASSDAKKRDRNSVYMLNFAMLILIALMCVIYGVKEFLIIQLAVMTIASTAGVWLFYVQHQFEDVYWERDGAWDFSAAAFQGSSYYQLPKILQWFTGNIGFHHIHHLSPKIPNYYLEKCHRSHPVFQQVKTIKLIESFKTASYRLWDEKRKKLIGFAELKRRARE